MPGTHVGVIGLGYIGLPLALRLAAGGYRVTGVDVSPEVRGAIEAGRPLFFEPGVREALRDLPPGRFRVAAELPGEPLDAIILCVGTAVDPETRTPHLTALHAAAESLPGHVTDDTLVIVRSTVSVGTCRSVVLPQLTRSGSRPLLAMCPERTIQGTAMREITTLPQIIGGLDEASAHRAARILAPVCPDQVRVSSIEAAELAKLICNAHTDLIYGFGNEIALISEGLGLDANEIIAAANLRYPRPDLHRPGFVGGSCLVKDPYLLLASAAPGGQAAPMVSAARTVNESIPHHVVRRLVESLKQNGKEIRDSKILVLGVAYKGYPETDDVRGSAAEVVGAELAGEARVLAAHDPVVDAARIGHFGFLPSELDEGIRDADAIVILTDSPVYRNLTLAQVRGAAPSVVVFDVWGVADAALSGVDGITYLRLGRG
ncbi:nucleotide sugar dehydrogenase [Amycolatopsis sp. NBC_00345]|uniref:nucleotide sugar dehydrogenase n=1 Tax=Amycolatopsis sp. NBC_00345 TaxID=2975955 RepID=UPI002E25E8E3